MEIGGATVGTTGTAFIVNTPAAGVIGGRVIGGSSFLDKDFTVPVVARQKIPISLTLHQTYNTENHPFISDVVWTLTPKWAGGAAVTAKPNENQYAVYVQGLLATAHMDPPAGNGAVAIELSFKLKVKGTFLRRDWGDNPPSDEHWKLDEFVLSKPSHALILRLAFAVDTKTAGNASVSELTFTFEKIFSDG